MRTMLGMLLGLVVTLTPLAAAEWVAGEVKRVDPAAGKITVKHEEIKELKMPSMTMVFSLKDPAWAKQVKPGQTIRFQAKDLGGGKMMIEELETKKSP